MIEIEKKRDAQKDEIAELTSQKKKLKNKIDVLASIHAKRDVQVRQDRVDHFRVQLVSTITYTVQFH